MFTSSSNNLPANAIIGCESLAFTNNEISYIKALKPLGLILFSRNISSPEQVLALTQHFRDLTNNPYAMVLIDQEGGRVSRLPRQHWRIPPSPTVFAKMFENYPEDAIKACFINYQLIALDLKQSGINVNCAPMLDMPQADASTVVTDRALGNNNKQVIALAQATINGLQTHNVEPVIKHMPGHGRGTLDSHKALPRVSASLEELSEHDFAPFTHFADQTMAMTAHILFGQLDPKLPATLSPKIINDIVREQIGFKGLIMTDDIDMHALSGSVSDKAKQAIEAGCDIVLQCSGKFEDLSQLESALDELSGPSLVRAENAAKACYASADTSNDSTLSEQLIDELTTLLNQHGYSND